MNNSEKSYWIAISAFEGIGPRRFKALINYFGSAKAVWEASEKKLQEINLGAKLITKFINFRNNLPVSLYFDKIKKNNIHVITLLENEYPKLLKEIADSPFVIYVRGDLDKDWGLDKSTIAVVGTRKITAYGKSVTEKITAQLSEMGITVVSGLAYGVDTVAHETAIKNNGKTIAVLGCGIDIIYPAANTKLYWDIVNKYGLIISEFPPGQLVTKGLFPSRNRIISGLSLGTVVTEGAIGSGALITAKYALDQGREVFAIPGPITSDMSAAPTILLKQGAKLVTDAKDILEELNIKNNPIIQLTNKPINDQINKLSDDEKKIIELLGKEDLFYDDLVRLSQLATDKLGGILTVMEMKNLIRNNSGIYGLVIS